MEKELDTMIERFPAFRGKIIELFNSNGDFKALCKDYWQCKAALLKLRETILKDTRNENGYKALYLELEQEALHYFDLTR